MTTHLSRRMILAVLLTVSWLAVAAPGVARGGTPDQSPPATPAPQDEPAQAPETPPAPSPAPASPDAAPADAAAAPAPAQTPPASSFDDRSRAVVRMGQSYTLPAGQRVREVVVISGSAQIDGEVDRDVVVILGTATLGSSARVGQSMVVVGGAVVVEPGARIDGDFVVVGGGADAPADFRPGREHVIIGPPIGVPVRSALPWVTRGLLLGRPIVPSLAWNWILVGVSLLIALLIALVFTQPVRVSAAVLAERPLTAFLSGLLVLMLAGPVAVILAITVVGIALIPFMFAAMAIAGVLGRVSVAVWLGDRLVAPDPEARTAIVRSLLIGSALIVLTYMVPILGFVVWALVGVLGLGAATVALVGALNRERPQRPSQQPPVPGAGAGSVPPPPGTGAGFAMTSEAGEETPHATPDPSVGAVGATPSPPPVVPAVDASAAQLLTFPRAGLLIRLAAVGLDVLLVAIADGLMDLTERGGAFLILLLAYHIVFWIWKGTTVGGIICHLRLVRVDGATVRPGDAVVRGLVGIFSVIVVGLGFLWILKDPERQSWHDKVAGTYVVTVPNNWPV